MWSCKLLPSDPCPHFQFTNPRRFFSVIVANVLQKSATHGDMQGVPPLPERIPEVVQSVKPNFVEPRRFGRCFCSFCTTTLFSFIQTMVYTRFFLLLFFKKKLDGVACIDFVVLFLYLECVQVYVTSYFHK